MNRPSSITAAAKLDLIRLMDGIDLLNEEDWNQVLMVISTAIAIRKRDRIKGA